jgi:hypothetical protein
VSQGFTASPPFPAQSFALAPVTAGRGINPAVEASPILHPVWAEFVRSATLAVADLDGAPPALADRGEKAQTQCQCDGNQISQRPVVLLLRVGRTYPAGTLNQRDYCSGNSQRHTDAVDGTPFAAFESVHDSDSTDHAASRADSFPVDLHFPS